MLKKLSKLNYGDTIGLVAPGCSFPFKKFKKAEANLKKLGFRVKYSKNIWERHKIFAGKDLVRAKDLNKMFADKKVRMILAVRGGYGTSRILRYLDRKIIRKNPKILMGFSDVTSLLIFLNKEFNIPTFHGPMLVKGFETTINRELLIDFENFFMGSKKEIKIRGDKNTRIIRRGKGRGILIGGNLSNIVSTLGTKYEIDTKGKILFLEDIDEEPYKIDRMIAQLKFAGKLDRIKGLIFGNFVNCKSAKSTLSLDQVISDNCVGLKIPILKDFPIGHGKVNRVMPIGARVELDASGKWIQIKEAQSTKSK